jgi:hypothetical protein
MDNIKEKVNYKHTSFLSLTDTKQFAYDFKLSNPLLKSIIAGDEIDHSTFELLILNLITTNTLINRKNDPNWTIIMHKFLNKYFSNLKTDKFKTLKGLECLKVKCNLTIGIYFRK